MSNIRIFERNDLNDKCDIKNTLCYIGWFGRFAWSTSPQIINIKYINTNVLSLCDAMRRRRRHPVLSVVGVVGHSLLSIPHSYSPSFYSNVETIPIHRPPIVSHSFRSLTIFLCKCWATISSNGSASLQKDVKNYLFICTKPKYSLATWENKIIKNKENESLSAPNNVKCLFEMKIYTTNRAQVMHVWNKYNMRQEFYNLPSTTIIIITTIVAYLCVFVCAAHESILWIRTGATCHWLN